MRTISSTVDIAAAPAEVWAVLVDTDGYASWNPVITSLTGQLTPGSKIKVRIKPVGAPPMTVRPTVAEAVPGELLSWRGGAGIPGMLDGQHEFVLSPSSAFPGGTLLVHRETFTGALVPLAGFLLTRLERGYQKMDAAMKTHVESRHVAESTGA